MLIAYMSMNLQSTLEVNELWEKTNDFFLYEIENEIEI